MPRKRYTYAEFSADLALFDVAPNGAASLTLAALKGRYATRVKVVHPDKPGGSTEKAAALNAANDRIKDWIKRGKPAWAGQGSEPSKPDPAAAAARAAEAEERRRREAAKAKVDRERREAEEETRKREAAAEQERRKQAKADLEREAAAARAEAAAQREREAAELRRAELEAERRRIERERAERKRRLLLWPVVAPVRLAGAVVERVGVWRVACIIGLATAISSHSSFTGSHVAASLPAMPSLGLPLAAGSSEAYRSGMVYTNEPPDRLNPSSQDRRCSLIDNRCSYR